MGEGITATWNSEVELPEETTVTTLVKGDGEAVAEGDTVSTYLWVGNGTSKEDIYNDYDNGAPEPIPNDRRGRGSCSSRSSTGATYGSRVVAVTTPTEVFGESVEGNSLGVTATDSLVIVADLVEKQAVAPTPTDDKAHDAEPEHAAEDRRGGRQAHRAGLRGHRGARARHAGPARRPQGGHGCGRQGVATPSASTTSARRTTPTPRSTRATPAGSRWSPR